MTIHIDCPPTKECKNIDTYGTICVKCNECGRFDYGGVSNPVRSEIRVNSQFHEGIPPFWNYPVEEATYCEGVWLRYRSIKGKPSQGNLGEMVDHWWNGQYVKGRLDHVRWWLEGRNY